MPSTLACFAVIALAQLPYRAFFPSSDLLPNSQAKALGIERPILRNGKAIANQNTLIYLLINLRFLHRLTHPDADLDD